MDNKFDELITRTTLTIGLMCGIMGYTMGVFDKMFGDQEKIPKGVVKELMEGAIAGIIDYFDKEIYGLKQEIEQQKAEIIDRNQAVKHERHAKELCIEKVNKLQEENDKLSLKLKELQDKKKKV